ncbi:MAG: hypothetical protein KAX37_08820, partial [Opitutaceae bacterium]|nr:hypothetical protein [Opitutaceae bacterium]
LPDASESMVRHSERLLVLASGQESGQSTFDTTIKLLEDPLAFIDHSQSQLEGLIARLEDSIQQIDRLIRSEVLLNRAVAPLTYIQTIFKIESAGLDHSVQQMFIALTEDIERLHQQVSQTFGEKFAVLRLARDTIEKVVAQLRADAKSQGLILREKRQGVERALIKLNTDLKDKETSDIKIRNASRTVNQQVGQLVMSLQTQDIVSQKLAHVESAIPEIIRRHELGLTESEANATGQDLAYCATSCRLQEAHLEAIGHDLEQAHKDISGASQEIQNQITQLDQDCLFLDEFDKVVAEPDRLVPTLLNTIEEVRTMVHKAVTTAEQAYTAIRPIGGLASNLTGVMRELSAQIQLIALNAQVQAAHNCGGTGLEVLASGTALISTDTREISEKVASGVDSLTVDLTRLVDAFEQLRQQGAQRRDLMEGDARTKELELHAMRDETLKELTEVGSALQQINDLIGAMVSENTLNTAAAERLTTLRAAFTSAADDTESHLQRAGVALDPSRFANELAKAYSVASEHEVQRRVLRLGPPPVTLTGPKDLTFDRQVHSDAIPSAGLPANPDAGNEGIPLRGDSVIVIAGVPAETTDAAAKKDNSLGDNIELF